MAIRAKALAKPSEPGHLGFVGAFEGLELPFVEGRARRGTQHVLALRQRCCSCLAGESCQRIPAGPILGGETKRLREDVDADDARVTSLAPLGCLRIAFTSFAS